MTNGVFLTKEYGRVIITLKDTMAHQGITRNRLARLTGLVYNSINRYYQNAPIASVDLNILARICFVLNCSVDDVLKYERPEQRDGRLEDDAADKTGNG